MTQQSKDELLASIMQSVAENRAGWFDRLFAFFISERLRAGESFSLSLVRGVFAETSEREARCRHRVTLLNVQRIYEALAHCVASLLKLRGTDCHTEVFRLIFER